MAWVERMMPSDQDEQFESWRQEFLQERSLRIVREREIMKETAERCKSYKKREQEANDAIERKRQAILAQRKAATVQATMRFQRNLPGFTVMDPEKFDRAIETITGRQLSNRSTPRRPPTNLQQRPRANITFRRSISMEELGSQQPIYNPYKSDPRNPSVLARTNSVVQVPQYINPVQYTSPLQEVQRQVLNDFAAQVQSTLHHHNNNNMMKQIHGIVKPQKISGPIVRPTPIVNIPQKKPLNTSAFDTKTIDEQQELLRRSYHESFFVKNTPVTGDEQVAAWLGAGKTNGKSNIMQKPTSLDGNESETNKKQKSILKRSPSIESNLSNNKPIVPMRKGSAPQTRTIGEKARVKDSLEVINTKLLKDMEIQKKTVRFAQDTDNERCVSDTQLVKQPDIGIRSEKKYINKKQRFPIEIFR
ncbi:hypothetical protein I4U23_017794 [Adineta vaga]|nr:hypothetical protein I4U23_017794 [Adineta vaga]